MTGTTEVILKEKYFPPGGTRAKTRKIELLFPDQDLLSNWIMMNSNCSERRSKPPLFHFLDDNAKPWSKRCDFVIFYVNGHVLPRRLHRVQVEEPERR